MKRGLIYCFLVILPVALFAQFDDTPRDSGKTFNMGGMIGAVSAGNRTYTQIRLMPEINIWKFGFGLDIDLLIDSEGNLREEDWDEAKDIVNKIYYIRFAQRGEPFYARIGGFPMYSVAYGLIMNEYSNMMLYPEVRQIGAMVGFNLPLPLKPGMEVFSSNVQKNEILAGRVHCSPLSATDVPLLKNVVVGVSAATDRNQYGKYNDKDNDEIPDIFDPNNRVRNLINDIDGDGIANNVDLDIDGDMILDSPLINLYVADQYPGLDDLAIPYLDQQLTTLKFYDEESEVVIVGADYTLHLIDKDLFKLSHYAEYAKIKDYGSGMIFPGFYSKILIFDLNLEFRRFEDKFLPGYFNFLYDEQRSFAVAGDTLLTKESLLENVKMCFGWYGSVKAYLWNFLYFKLAYQDMYGEDVTTGKSLWATAGLMPKIIPNLKEISVSYAQSNMPHIALNKLKTPEASVGGKLSYAISHNTFLVGRYTERYVDYDGNGKISGKDETVKFMNFGVEFLF